MVLTSIDTSAKGGQYQEPFYSRQIIKGKVTLLANGKVVMATIEGLLVLSSQALTPLLREDNTSNPSVVAKSSKASLTCWQNVQKNV